MLNTLFVMALMTAADVPTRPLAPAPGCLDARSVTQMRQLTPTELLVSTGDSAHYQLYLADVCTADEPGASLVSSAGWVCGKSREYVKTTQRACAITHVQTLTSREFSELVHEADLDDGVLMAVETRGERESNGFRGSYDYCFRPSTVRSWNADGEGILVRTSRKRSGGFGSYRVEFASTCPEVAYLGGLSWRSGVGLDLICGNPGDAALLSSATTPDVWKAESRIVHYLPPHGQAQTPAARGCTVAAVYPIDL